MKVLNNDCNFKHVKLSEVEVGTLVYLNASDIHYYESPTFMKINRNDEPTNDNINYVIELEYGDINAVNSDTLVIPIPSYDCECETTSIDSLNCGDTFRMKLSTGVFSPDIYLKSSRSKNSTNNDSLRECVNISTGKTEMFDSTTQVLKTNMCISAHFPDVIR